jgi:hypothetical protein
MIAVPRPTSKTTQTNDAHDRFVAMLPRIRTQATLALRGLDAEVRENAIQEVMASSFVAFVRLVELGRTDLAYASALAGFAIKQYRAGRQVGGRRSVRDVMSRHAQRMKGFRVLPLGQEPEGEDDLRAVLVEDRSAGPAETAAARIDVAQWLRRLNRRHRRIAQLLASGETTNEAARRFGVSRARVSQLRQELRQSWLMMQGEWPTA